MNEFKTGAVRDTGGKGRMDLLPMCALLRVSKHMEDAITPDPETGTPHYPERNWEKGIPMHSMLDSAMRHLVKYLDGWDDEDHLCAAATNLLMAMWTEEKKPEMQDIPSRTEVHVNKEDLVQDIANHTKCRSYDSDMGRCFGTKEMDPCNCGGDPTKCDFYPEKRKTVYAHVY